METTETAPQGEPWRICPVCRIKTTQYRQSGNLLFCPDCKHGTIAAEWRVVDAPTLVSVGR